MRANPDEEAKNAPEEEVKNAPEEEVKNAPEVPDLINRKYYKEVARSALRILNNIYLFQPMSH